jgi:hypothetical protein
MASSAVHNQEQIKEYIMNFFKIEQNPHAPVNIIVTAISKEAQHGEGWVYEHDFKSFEEATKVAEAASIFVGIDYIPTESNGYFDVVRAPKLNDPVSYAFNGDYYPCGYIKSISKTMKKITTTDGDVFYRRRNTGTWLKHNVWSLVSGHHNERNPHF